MSARASLKISLVAAVAFMSAVGGFRDRQRARGTYRRTLLGGRARARRRQHGRPPRRKCRSSPRGGVRRGELPQGRLSSRWRAGGYLQEVRLQSRQIDEANFIAQAVSPRAASGRSSSATMRHCILRGDVTREVDAPLVFAGYGLSCCRNTASTISKVSISRARSSWPSTRRRTSVPGLRGRAFRFGSRALEGLQGGRRRRCRVHSESARHGSSVGARDAEPARAFHGAHGRRRSVSRVIKFGGHVQSRALLRAARGHRPQCR